MYDSQNYDLPTEIDIDSKLLELKTVSEKIRFLDQKGYKRSEIAKKLQKRYQHVKNVLDYKK
jgi:hypothetical protein